MRAGLGCEDSLKQQGFQVRSSETLSCDLVVPLGSGLGSLQFLVRDLSLTSTADAVAQVLTHLRTLSGIAVLVSPQRNPNKFMAVQNAVLSSTGSTLPLLSAASAVEAVAMIAWRVQLFQQTQQELPPPAINVCVEIRDALSSCMPLERNFEEVFAGHAAVDLSHVAQASASDFQAAVPQMSRQDALAVAHFFNADTETKD